MMRINQETLTGDEEDVVVGAGFLVVVVGEHGGEPEPARQLREVGRHGPVLL